MFRRFQERFRMFMIGRYGADQLSRFMAFLVLALCVLHIVVRVRPVQAAIEGIELILLVLLYARIFSRDFERRRRENDAYLRLRFRLTEGLRGLRFRLDQSRQYKIFRCPGCGQKVRVPRGHGKISVRCPKCGQEFLKRS